MWRSNICITAILLTCAVSKGAAHVNIPVSHKPDSLVIELNEISISHHDTSNSLQLISAEGGVLGVKALRKMTSFMGQNDPIRIMQSLPAVASNDVISGGIYVQGCENSHNFITIDGAQVYNPSHLFGIFSVFNTPHFQRFDISTDSHRAIDSNFIGAKIEGVTSDDPACRTSVDASIGVIDSHATVSTPIKAYRSALTVSGRVSYINAVFGNSLKLDNAPIRYGFSDWNATYLHKIGDNRTLKISGYFGSDNMRLPDPNYASDLKFGWTNGVVSASFSESNRQRHTLSFSSYSNRLSISYSNINSRIRSGLTDYAYSGFYKAGNISLAASAHLRNIAPQQNISSRKTRVSTGEISVAADWDIVILPKWSVRPGLRLAGYAAKSFQGFYPLPSLTSTLRLKNWMIFTVNLSRLAQFNHKIEESNMGLPTDYWIPADGRFKPLRADCGIASVSGNIVGGVLSYSVTGYYRKISNLTDWCGMLFNILSDSYDPSDDVVSGKGRARGISCLLSVTTGNLRGWVSYNYGKSQINVVGKNPGWHPTSHDRTHDFNITLSLTLLKNLNASASWVYATGRPYTEPLYGYILGENLICEFKPLNSSRLPAMHRLDLSVDWTFWHKGGIRQGLTASLYNAYAHANTLFVSYDYKPDKGFYKRNMDFKAVIPYISYYLKF